ncbi:flagellar biosynthetic protein FliQ [Jannaschia sp. Os4]|uniref:flagellar biosynthetic protein FliQ n=1 Tax=Jannaschia sp. Os4 TaxID=2807617 RepID=UPI0019398545|nr:flagellar biosynthetic protein FliQ [Jannaschia sp. Os4]MBM2575659.1 flagellar biosynthetic protein FliQ [Jannaschia sp. Os4]
MRDADAYAIFTETIWAILFAAGPILAIATGVGLVIALFQALTQVQEMTLTFVPKIAAIFVGLIVFVPFCYGVVARLAETVFDLIGGGLS